eukprot:COSAG06_NODE_1438_length_9460_cov_20.641491_2_plen_154_part_00
MQLPLDRGNANTAMAEADGPVDWKQRACEYYETLQELQAKCTQHQLARETAEERSRDLYAKEQRAVDTDNHKDRQIRDLQLEKASLQRDVEQLCQGLKVRRFCLRVLAPLSCLCSTCVRLGRCAAGGHRMGGRGRPRGRGADRVHGAGDGAED